MAERQIIEADLTWCGSPARFERGVRIAVDQHGMIEEVGKLSKPATLRLRDRAIIPGMINVHSHAFQRGLRGRGETFPQGAGNLWTCREAMYGLVATMDEQTLHRLSVQCFREMLMAGVTAVGEFHYLHHDASMGGFAFDEVMLRAAAEAGIRIVLINTYYKTGAVGKPLQGGQLRFRVDTPEEFWVQMDRLKRSINPAKQSLAAAAHSIRAAPIEDISALHQESIRRGLPFHMHVEEQPLEIEECLAVYGKTPMALLNEHLDINPLFTAVHCTHTAAADLEEYMAAGGNVCINPLTEGNLGDGIPDVPRIVKSQGRIALGSDSNARLCWMEEMRWLEYAQRLRLQQRGICVDETGSVAAKVFEAATSNAARCLGLKAGRLAPKHVADFALIDLSAPQLAGWSEQTLLDSLILGTGNEAIAGACVGGTWMTRTHAIAGSAS